jgi:hypothetical protein
VSSFYQQPVSREDYEEMRAARTEELATAELNLGQSRASAIPTWSRIHRCPYRAQGPSFLFKGSGRTAKVEEFVGSATGNRTRV